MKQTYYLILLLILSGCTYDKSSDKSFVHILPIEEEGAISVVSEEVKKSDFPLTIESRGMVQPGEERVIVAPFTSIIKEIYATPGYIQKGDRLFLLDKNLIEQELLEAQDELLISQIRFAEKLALYPSLVNVDNQNIREFKKSIESLEEKFLNGNISLEDYTEQHTTLTISIIREGGYSRDIQEIETGMRASIRKIIKLKKQLENSVVTSPISGQILFELYEGMMVEENSPLGTIYSFEKSRARLNILERDIHTLYPGQKVNLSPGVNYLEGIEGVITFISPERNKDSGGYTAFVDFNPPDGTVFKGMPIKGEIVLEVLKDRVVIPKEAVLREGDRYYVFVIEDGVANWRWIDIEHRNDRYLTVKADDSATKTDGDRIYGLDPGETIAVEGHTLLSHKAKVQ